MQTNPTQYEDAIRARAYQFWIEEGRPEGRHDIHWQRALASLTPSSLVPEAKVAMQPVATTNAPAAAAKPKILRAKAAKPRAK